LLAMPQTGSGSKRLDRDWRAMPLSQNRALLWFWRRGSRQSPLKQKAFSTLPDPNPPVELRPENRFRLPTKACSANGRSSTTMPSSD